MSPAKLLFSFAAIAILCAGCQTTPSGVRTVSIAQARAMGTNQLVRVNGVVTVQSGAFASSISSGFAIQDETGGIYVISDKRGLERGQRVEVVGYTGVEAKQLNMERLKSVRRFKGRYYVAYRTLRTGEISEAHQGLQIRTSGAVTRVEADLPYGHKVWIDDGTGEHQVFINASVVPSDRGNQWQSGRILDVQGFAGRYNDVLEILPRSMAEALPK